MRLSPLQKYILEQGYSEPKPFNRDKLLKFYNNYKKPPLKEDQINIITKSLERMTDKELLIAYGIRTHKKWFIKEIKLTLKGIAMAKKLLSRQQILPLRKRKLIKDKK